MCNKKTEHIIKFIPVVCVGGVVFHDDSVVITTVITAGVLSVRGSYQYLLKVKQKASQA